MELVTQDRARKPLEQTRTRNQVIRWLAEGRSNSWIAEQTGMVESSVWRFKQRYQIRIDALVQKISQRVEDLAIAQKANRIGKLDWMASQLEQELTVNGIAWDEQTRYGSKRRISGAATELRMTLRQAAEELDQLPRAGVTVHNQNVVIVKHVEGAAELD